MLTLNSSLVTTHRHVNVTWRHINVTNRRVACRHKVSAFSDIFVDQLFEESHFFGRYRFFVAAAAVVIVAGVVAFVVAAVVAVVVAAGVVPRHPMIKIKRLVDNICMSASTTKNLVWRIKFRLENVLPSFVEKIFSENISKTFWLLRKSVKKWITPIQSNDPKIWLSLQKCFLKSAKWHHCKFFDVAIRN